MKQLASNLGQAKSKHEWKSSYWSSVLNAFRMLCSTKVLCKHCTLRTVRKRAWIFLVWFFARSHHVLRLCAFPRTPRSPTTEKNDHSSQNVQPIASNIHSVLQLMKHNILNTYSKWLNAFVICMNHFSCFFYLSKIPSANVFQLCEAND